MQASSQTSTPRIISLDQFRGYTVAGMFLVNFVGNLKSFPQVLKHHDVPWFSYADSIMPSFMFAAGVSFRLAMLRRIANDGPRKAYTHAVLRGLGLVLVSLLMYTREDIDQIKHWADMTPETVAKTIGTTLKANLWETLAIIGVVQILILPVVTRSVRVRSLTILAFLAFHVVISYFFNFAFVYGLPNGLDTWLGLTGKSAWDGGFFGVFGWAIPMLFGTLAYDVVIANTPWGSTAKLFGLGAVLLALGYGASCVGTLYNPDRGTVEMLRPGMPASPVLPPFANMKDRSLESLLATPPFLEPAKDAVPAHCYWAMNKKMVSLPFTLFASGFAFVVLALFIPPCDIGGVQIGIFRTFGLNPLLAYIVHHAVEEMVLTVWPEDSPLWFGSVGLALFLTITYVIMRYFERHKIYLRL